MSRSIALLFFFWFSGLANAGEPCGLDSRVAMGLYLDARMPELAPDVAGNWKTVPAFPKLAFKNPIGLCVFTDSKNLVVWEREGRVWTFANDSNSESKKLVLDLSNQCQGWDDSGLLALAFHPKFKTNDFHFFPSSI